MRGPAIRGQGKKTPGSRFHGDNGSVREPTNFNRRGELTVAEADEKIFRKVQAIRKSRGGDQDVLIIENLL
jgi:hypothetical protein